MGLGLVKWAFHLLVQMSVSRLNERDSPAMNTSSNRALSPLGGALLPREGR